MQNTHLNIKCTFEQHGDVASTEEKVRKDQEEECYPVQATFSSFTLELKNATQEQSLTGLQQKQPVPQLCGCPPCLQQGAHPAPQMKLLSRAVLA
jgi:hypothetical protein